MTLNLYKNCSVTPTHTITLPANINGSTVVNAVTETGATFSSGVYRIELVTKAVSGLVHKEYICKYIDCDSIKCGLIDEYATGGNKLLAYMGLEASNNCPQCTCESMCSLNNILTAVTDECECGCCKS